MCSVSRMLSQLLSVVFLLEKDGRLLSPSFLLSVLLIAVVKHRHSAESILGILGIGAGPSLFILFSCGSKKLRCVLKLFRNLMI